MSKTRSLSWLVFGMCVLLGAGGAVAAEDLVVGLNFTGSTLHVDSVFVPPDTMGAVGPDHVVELINGRYSVYRKGDGVRIQTSTLNDFWIDAGVAVRNFAFDPRILYDAPNERWYAVSVHDGRAPDGAVLMAVSRSWDPTEGWFGFEVDPDPDNSCWSDFPTLGMHAEFLYVAVEKRDVSGGPCGVGGSPLLVVPKEDLLAGTNLVPVVTFAGFDDTGFENFGDEGVWKAAVWETIPENLWPDKNQSTRAPRRDEDVPVSEVRVTVVLGLRGEDSVQPIVDLDATGVTPVIALSLPRGGFLDRLGRWEFRPDFPFLLLTRKATIGLTPYRLAGFGGKQPPPKRWVDIHMAHLSSNVVLRNGTFWGVHAANEFSDFDIAVRWFRIDAETNEVLQEGLIERDGMTFFYPSIAVNEFDDVVIGFNGSSETEFIGSYAVLGRTRDGVTTFGEPLLLQAGQAGYERIPRGSRNRWGDYSATVVDPTNPQVFWTFQEYVSAEDIWSTRITQLVAVPERFIDKFELLDRELRPPIVTVP